MGCDETKKENVVKRLNETIGELDRLSIINEELQYKITILEEKNSCGNPKHPDGPWHPSSPYPYGILDTIKQMVRRHKYGCGCAVGKKL